MKFLHLVWSNLMRKKIRTGLTVLSIFVAFMLFGVLRAVQAAFGVGVELAGLDRLVTIHNVSIIQPLPISYLNRIKATPGVEDATYSVWFGGIYQDPKNFFPQIAVSPEDYLRIYPEYVLTEEEKQRWFETRTGAVVGSATAERFGWKIGDRIPIQGTIYRPPGEAPWEFEIVGIYEGSEKSTDKTNLFFHYDYLDQTMGGNLGLVGWYIVKIADPEAAPTIAERIDSQFANSPAETETTREDAFIQGFASQTGNISKIVTGIVSVVFFTMLLVAGNTMAQSVRERIGELAVLKTLGFTGRQVMSLVLAESLLLAVVGGGGGLLLIWWLISNGLTVPGLPPLYLAWSALGLGLALVLALGFVAGALPALQALRLDIVNALRKV